MHAAGEICADLRRDFRCAWFCPERIRSPWACDTESLGRGGTRGVDPPSAGAGRLHGASTAGALLPDPRTADLQELSHLPPGQRAARIPRLVTPAGAASSRGIR